MKRWLRIWGDAVLSDFRWYRSAIGGHWECWTIDHPVNDEVWMQTIECHYVTGKYPPLGRYRPLCEDYTSSP